MKYQALAATLALQAAAYPFVAESVSEEHQNLARQLPGTLPAAGSPAAVALSKSRKNCGLRPCLVFNKEEQFVSTTGNHAWKAPGGGDIRGVCPGLNAAANHGYLNRAGVTTLPETITGLAAAYNMSPDLAGFLAAVAIILNGDPVLGQWSIGGPPPDTNPLNGVVTGAPQGIDYSHNSYEGDASITRDDVYLLKNGNDPATMNLDKFTQAYKATTPGTKDRYDLHTWAGDFDKKLHQSIATNPYFFSAPFSGLVAPAAYNFVINFMSNRTADNPNGYLDGKMFKTFFSVTGEPGSFKWNRGLERIPDNWYKRTATNQYNAADVFGDLIPQFLAYPDSFVFGGNTGKTNSFVGFDFGDLTNGATKNSQSLLTPQALQCFFANAALAGIPDFANSPLLNSVNGLIGQHIAPVLTSANCPPNQSLNKRVFSGNSKFPGSSFKPTPPK